MALIAMEAFSECRLRPTSDRCPGVTKWRVDLADLTGGCNSLLESFGWRFVVQGLSRTLERRLALS